MANVIEFVVRAKDAASGVLRGIGSAMGGFVRGLANLQLATQFIGRIYDRFAQLIRSSVGSYIEAERGVNALSNALALTKEATYANMQGLQEFAAEIAKVSQYDDDLIISSMAQAKAMGIGTAQLKRATVAAMGLAAAYNMDLSTAMMLVTRANLGSTAMLARYGIVLDRTLTKEQKFAEVLRIGATKFSLVEKATATTAGRLTQLGNAWGEVREAIGKKVVTGLGLAGFFDAVKRGLTKLEEYIAGNTAIDGFIQKVRDAAIEVAAIGVALANPEKRKAVAGAVKDVIFTALVSGAVRIRNYIVEGMKAGAMWFMAVAPTIGRIIGDLARAGLLKIPGAKTLSKVGAAAGAMTADVSVGDITGGIGSTLLRRYKNGKKSPKEILEAGKDAYNEANPEGDYAKWIKDAVDAASSALGTVWKGETEKADKAAQAAVDALMAQTSTENADIRAELDPVESKKRAWLRAQGHTKRTINEYGAKNLNVPGGPGVLDNTITGAARGQIETAQAEEAAAKKRFLVAHWTRMLTWSEQLLAEHEKQLDEVKQDTPAQRDYYEKLKAGRDGMQRARSEAQAALKELAGVEKKAVVEAKKEAAIRRFTAHRLGGAKFAQDALGSTQRYGALGRGLEGMSGDELTALAMGPGSGITDVVRGQKKDEKAEDRFQYMLGRAKHRAEGGQPLSKKDRVLLAAGAAREKEAEDAKKKAALEQAQLDTGKYTKETAENTAAGMEG